MNTHDGFLVKVLKSHETDDERYDKYTGYYYIGID